MGDWSWVWALIPIAAILSWGVRGVVQASRGGGTATGDLKTVKERLDSIDTRLAAVEKTLNDIP